jgi:DNA-binding transcriptional LysR family regulator
VARSSERGSREPRGIVRVTAPPGVAYDFLAPLSADLRARVPGIEIHLLSSTHYVDLGRREADIAVRLRRAASRDLVTLLSLEHRVAAYAAPSYLARLPRRYGFHDIAWIGWAPPLDGLPPNPQLQALIPGFRPAFASDDFLVQWRAAEAGLGAIVLPRLRHRFTRTSVLEPLALDLGPHTQSALHVICHKSARDIPRVRVVAEAIVEELSRAEHLSSVQPS